MTTSNRDHHVIPRAQRWLEAITGRTAVPSFTPAVIYADANLGGNPMRAIAVVPNPTSRSPRARSGQVGIDEGWELARCIRSVTNPPAGHKPCALLAIVDVPGQAFGLQEEIQGLHVALAAAADAYATARLLGHPVVTLLVGKAISGAFLAHGLQSARIFALDSDQIEIHVMSRASVARVTRRTVEEVQQLETKVPATGRDLHSFAALGGVDQIIACKSIDSPEASDVNRIQQHLLTAFDELRVTPGEPVTRLDLLAAREARKVSRFVRDQLDGQWD